MAEQSGGGSNKGSDEQILSGQQGQSGEYGEQASETMTDPAEGAGARDQSDGMTGQPIGGNDSNTGSGTTLSQGADFGEGALQQASTSSSGQQSSDSASDGSSGQGFIGSQGASRNDGQGSSGSPASATSPSSAGASGGSDFASQGRGALDEEDMDDEANSGGGAP